MNSQLSLSIIEIIVLMMGAIVLGITIHFFISSKKSLKASSPAAMMQAAKDVEEWKLRYFNEIEYRDKELENLKKKLAEEEENNQINTIEAEETKKQNKKLLTELQSLRSREPVATKNKEEWEARYLNEIEYRDKELENLKKKLAEEEENNQINIIETEETKKQNKRLLAEIQTLKAQPQPSSASATSAATPPAGDYLNQLYQAQSSLKEYQEKINHILGQIDIVKEAEEKQKEILRSNEELSVQIEEMRHRLSLKENEIINIRQKQELTTEMASRLDNAYSEFSLLQDKIHKLEGQVQVSRKLNIEYEELKEEHYKMARDFEEQKNKYLAASTENQQLQASLNETEDRLREANFQRQQLQKKVTYLEELNNDLQEVTDANKKLEGQLKRIGELESRLNMVAEERDELAKKQIKT